MKHVKRYEDAVEAAVGRHGVEPNDDVQLQWHNLLNLACDLDRMAREQAEGARTMAERFARYAAEVEERWTTGSSTPCGYSTLDDIVRTAAVFSKVRDIFTGEYRRITGEKFAFLPEG